MKPSPWAPIIGMVFGVAFTWGILWLGVDYASLRGKASAQDGIIEELQKERGDLWEQRDEAHRQLRAFKEKAEVWRVKAEAGDEFIERTNKQAAKPIPPARGIESDPNGGGRCEPPPERPMAQVPTLPPQIFPQTGKFSIGDKVAFYHENPNPADRFVSVGSGIIVGREREAFTIRWKSAIDGKLQYAPFLARELRLIEAAPVATLPVIYNGDCVCKDCCCK